MLDWSAETYTYVIAAVATALSIAAALLLAAPHRREAAVPVHTPTPAAAQPGWKGELWDEAPLFAGGKVRCTDPATGYRLAELDADSPETIRCKIQFAADAQRNWRSSSWAERRQLLRTMHAWVQREMEPLARIACRDTGKTAVDAAFGELLTTCAKLQWTIRHGQAVLHPEYRAGNLLLAHKRCMVTREPLGVVAACVSWNYPVHNMLGPVIASLFSGNAVVIKCSEHVAWSSTHVLAAVRQCLAACGHSPELVQLVVCAPQYAEALTTDPRIAHITFIGSDAVGQRVAAAAATQLTPTTLELGGKDPAVLLPDADVHTFASMFMRACFQAAGQNCIGIERFVVAEPLVAPLVAAVRPRIEALRCGSFLDETRFGCGAGEDAVDMGAMISGARFEQLEALIRDAVAHGARLVCGGERLRHPRWPRGHYFAPTLLTGVRPEMAIAQQELFAPIFLVMAYQSEEEAVAIANGTRYGLGASVFGRNRAQCRRVARALRCGMVNINEYVCSADNAANRSFGVSYLNQGLPFGGCKKSGYGRFGGPEGLQGLTNAKAVTEDLLFGLVQTGIPPALDYPIRDSQRSWAFLQALLRLAFGPLPDRVRGVLGLVRASA